MIVLKERWGGILAYLSCCSESLLFYFCRILDILAYVVRVNNAAMNRLYKLGAFEILLWKLLAGDLVDLDKACIVVFIRQCHLSQVQYSLQCVHCVQAQVWQVQFVLFLLLRILRVLAGSGFSLQWARLFESWRTVSLAWEHTSSLFTRWCHFENDVRGILTFK